MDNQNNLKIVAYAADGSPLDIIKFKEKLDRGKKDFEEGRYLTSDELIEEMKSW